MGHKVLSLFLNQMTHGLVPLLEFVTSGKARDIVRALKRLSFGQNFHYKNKIAFARYENREWDSLYDCLFSNHFWSLGNSSEVIGTFLDKHEELKNGHEYIMNLYGSEEFVMKATPQWIADVEIKYGRKIKSEKVIY